MPAYDDDTTLAAFLRARRARLMPSEVGLADGARRRVPGLRREEVAMLAELSVTYYVRLEQGRDRRPSGDVVEALGRALQLDDAAARHLRVLAGVAPRPAAEAGPPAVRDELRRLLELHVAVPAFVIDRCSDVLAANRLATALHPSYQPGRNLLRDVFLDPQARAAYDDSDLPALLRDGVAALRATRASGAAGTDALVADLMASAEFAALWASHEVIEKRAGSQRFRHPEAGPLELDAEVFEISGTPGQRLVVFHPAPGSVSEQRLRALSGERG
ncbi:MAG TPA: helix-turn-helix transcriptional regulator [Conexibacter sp.]